MKKPEIRSSRMWITILKPPLTPGQREVFERLSQGKNFIQNPMFTKNEGAK